MSFAYSAQGSTYTVTDVVVPSVAANTTIEIAFVATGVAAGDIGFVVPTASPIVGFTFPYARATGANAAVLGVTNFTEGAIDPANTMDVTVVMFQKGAVAGAV